MVVDGTMSHRGFSTVDASPPSRHQTTLQKHGPRPDGDRWWSRWSARIYAVRR